MDPLAAIGASLRFAVVAAVIATSIGLLAATAINGSPRVGKLLDAGLMLPLGTSAVTIGLGMLITFDTPPVDWRARWCKRSGRHECASISRYGTAWALLD